MALTRRQLAARIFLTNFAAIGAGAAIAADTHSAIPMIVAGAFAAVMTAITAFGRKKVVKAVAPVAAALPEAYAARVVRLEERRRAIIAAAEANRNFDGGLMRAELEELEKLVTGFHDLAAASARWETHLATTDFEELEAELRRHETDAERAIDPAQRELAHRNLKVLLSRKEQLTEIRRKVTNAKGQLDLLENSFRLIADEVLAMQDPEEIKGKLDDLLAGVEAVRETTRDTGQRAAVRLEAQRSK